MRGLENIDRYHLHWKALNARTLCLPKQHISTQEAMFASIFSSGAEHAPVDYGDEGSLAQDVELGGASAAGGSDTMSMSHFRNASDDGASQSPTDIVEAEAHQKDSFPNGHAAFQKLGGAIDTLLVMNILIYLNAEDLASLSVTNKYFRRLSQSTLLWNVLYRRDFVLEDPMEQSETASQISLRPTLHSLITTHTGASHAAAFTKAMYARRYNEYHQRIARAKEEDQDAEMEAKRSREVSFLEGLLDFTQLRIFAAIFLGSIFLTIVLVCQRIDGLRIAYWMCFLPLLISLAYTFASYFLLRSIRGNKYSTTHFLRGLWNNVAGPFVTIVKEADNASGRLVHVIGVVLALCLLQVLLVAAKLSPSTPHHIRHHYLHWSVVFLPVWLSAVLYCVSPLLVPRLNMEIFVGVTIMLFVPFMIFFACLTAKLTGQENHTNRGRIRLALVLIPFWVLEGLSLVGSLGFLITGVYK
jgi:hypothetical protein